MDKNNKALWVLTILALVLFVFGIYQYHRAETLKNTPPVKEVPVVDNSQNSGQDYWNSVSQNALLQAVMDSTINTDGEIPDVSAISLSFKERVEITGDSTPEVMYSIPEWNGAYAESGIFFHKNIKGLPEVIKAKGEDGRVNIFELYQGASVMNQIGYKVYSNEMSVISFSMSRDGETGLFVSCDVEGYKWNSSTQLMEWDTDVVLTHKAEVCK